jgi:UDP-glucose 4-epimerase
LNILIIGSKGFIGQHLYKFFSEKCDYECWGCDVITEVDNSQYFSIDKSNCDFNAVFAQQNFDYCINCSGAANVSESISNPLQDFNLNVLNIGKLLEAIRIHNNNCKFVNLSSAAVYGNPHHLPVLTSAAIDPVSPYGWHKFYAEQLCNEYHQFFNIQTLNLRIFSAFGPGLKKQLFWDWFQNSIGQTEVSLYGTGNESRDFIYIDDLVQVIWLATKEENFKHGVVNVGNGNEVFIKEGAEIFFGFLNKIFAFKNQGKQSDPLNWVADIEEIKSWGYKQTVSLKEGLSNYIEWAKESG